MQTVQRCGNSADKAGALVAGFSTALIGEITKKRLWLLHCPHWNADKAGALTASQLLPTHLLMEWKIKQTQDTNTRSRLSAAINGVHKGECQSDITFNERLMVAHSLTGPIKSETQKL